MNVKLTVEYANGFAQTRKTTLASAVEGLGHVFHHRPNGKAIKAVLDIPVRGQKFVYERKSDGWYIARESHTPVGPFEQKHVAKVHRALGFVA
jgi:hypothetical protein